MRGQTFTVNGYVSKSGVTMRFTPSGKPVANFWLNTSSYNKTAEKDTEYNTYKVTLWGALAENCNEHLLPGQQVCVISLNPIKAEGWLKDGEVQAVPVVTATRVEFGPKARNGEEQDELPF